MRVRAELVFCKQNVNYLFAYWSLKVELQVRPDGIMEEKT